MKAWILVVVLLGGCIQSRAFPPISVPDVSSSANDTILETANASYPSEEMVRPDETIENETVHIENETLEDILLEKNDTIAEDAFCTPEQQQACEDACAKDPDGEACFYECVLVWGCP